MHKDLKLKYKILSDGDRKRFDGEKKEQKRKASNED